MENSYGSGSEHSSVCPLHFNITGSSRSFFNRQDYTRCLQENQHAVAVSSTDQLESDPPSPPHTSGLRDMRRGVDCEMHLILVRDRLCGSCRGEVETCTGKTGTRSGGSVYIHACIVARKSPPNYLSCKGQNVLPACRELVHEKQRWEWCFGL